MDISIPSEADMFTWEVVITGLDNTPYAVGPPYSQLKRLFEVSTCHKLSYRITTNADE